MNINAILAHDEQYGIGKQGKLPWEHSPADMKWFRDCTSGHVVIMGRKTWESLGCVNLPKRTNVVISTSEVFGAPDMICQGEMADILADVGKSYPERQIWVIGGAEIYRQALPFCDHIYVTEFGGSYHCDATVPMDRYLVGYHQAAAKKQDQLTFSIWSKG